MLYNEQESTLTDFFAQADVNGHRENEDGPVFIDRKYLPQEIVDLVEAMIRGEAGVRMYETAN